MTLWSKRMEDAARQGDDGVHREPLVRPALWRRRPRRLDRARPGLGHAGVLDDGDEARAARGARPGRSGARRRTASSSPTGDEDIHTAIERRVTELAGDAGAKLHTGRSRNDQVATALRLYVRRRLGEVAGRVLELSETPARTRGPTPTGVYLPGYTHLQRAQPVLLAHQLLAHGWALARDVDRLLDTRRRLDVSPLGAGALAGSSLPLDPDWVAGELGFAGPLRELARRRRRPRLRRRDAVRPRPARRAPLPPRRGDRRLCSSEEFGFYRLDDAWSTGSSMLPQKKNPDIAELARGKAGRLIGHLTGLPRDAEGPAARVQPGPPGGQGAAVRRVRPGRPRPAPCAGSSTTVRFDEEAMSSGRRRPGARRRRPRRVARRAGDAVPPRPTGSSGSSCGARSRSRSRSPSWSWPSRRSGERRAGRRRRRWARRPGRRPAPPGAATSPDQLGRFADRLRADRARLEEIGRPRPLTGGRAGGG